MARDRVMVDLRGIGDALRSHCQKNGIKNLSTFIVPALAKALGKTSPSRAVSDPKPDRAGRRRVSVFLEEDAHARLKARAAEAGLTISAYLATIGSGHDLPELPRAKLSPETLAALVQSNYELRAIGRNVNQIAHSLNAYPGKITASERAELTALHARLDAHVRQSAHVLHVVNAPKRRSDAALDRPTDQETA